MALINYTAFRQADLATEPFKYVVMPGFVQDCEAKSIRRDFPDIAYPGLLPVEATTAGPAFLALIDELTGPKLAAAFSEKFDVDLTGRPIMVTVRGRCQAKDGRIHTDSAAKLVTALLYFNDGWEAQGGRLRLLRGPNDLNDMIAEVPPELGTLVAFMRSDNSFHGHEPYVGVRRYVMINWMTSGIAAQRELLRHKLSAKAKKIMQYA
jgi:hypothetical protein